MEKHILYWKQLAERRIALFFGPVLDPNGIYGMAIVEVHEDALVNNIANNDPAIKSSAGFKFEIYPVVDPVLRN